MRLHRNRERRADRKGLRLTLLPGANQLVVLEMVARKKHNNKKRFDLTAADTRRSKVLHYVNFHVIIIKWPRGNEKKMTPFSLFIV